MAKNKVEIVLSVKDEGGAVKKLELAVKSLSSAFEKAAASANKFTAISGKLATSISSSNRAFIEMRNSIERISSIGKSMGNRMIEVNNALQSMKVVMANTVGTMKSMHNVQQQFNAVNKAQTGIIHTTTQKLQTYGATVAKGRGDVNNLAKGNRDLGDSFRNSGDKAGFVVMKVIRLMLAYAALRITLRTLRSEFAEAFKSIEEYHSRTVQVAALMTTFSERAAKGDVAGAYREAIAYARVLVAEMEKLDIQTIASAEDLMTMVQGFIQGGIQIDVTNKKTLESFRDIANALKVLIANMPMQEAQIAQEIRALINGQARATDMLGRVMRARLGSTWKEILAEWKAAGPDIFIQNIAKTLHGFGAAAKDVEGLWDTVKSSLETINRIILRGAFADMYNTIIQMGKALQDALRTPEGQLTELGRRVQRTFAQMWVEVKVGALELYATLKMIFALLSGFGEMLNKVTLGFVNISGVVKLGVLAALSVWITRVITGFLGLNTVIREFRTAYAEAVVAQRAFIAGANASAFSLQGLTFSATAAAAGIRGVAVAFWTFLKGNAIVIGIMAIVTAIGYLAMRSQQAKRDIEELKVSLIGLSASDVARRREAVVGVIKDMGATVKEISKAPKMTLQEYEATTKQLRDEVTKLNKELEAPRFKKLTEEQRKSNAEYQTLVKRLDEAEKAYENLEDQVGKYFDMEKKLREMKQRFAKGDTSVTQEQLRTAEKLLEVYQKEIQVSKEATSHFEKARGSAWVRWKQLKMEERLGAAGLTEQEITALRPRGGAFFGESIEDYVKNRTKVLEIYTGKAKQTLQELLGSFVAPLKLVVPPSEEDTRSAQNRIEDLRANWETLIREIGLMGAESNEVIEVTNRWYGVLERLQRLYRDIRDEKTGKAMTAGIQRDIGVVEKWVQKARGYAIDLAKIGFRELNEELRDLQQIVGDMGKPMSAWIEASKEGLQKITEAKDKLIELRDAIMSDEELKRSAEAMKELMSARGFDIDPLKSLLDDINDKIRQLEVNATALEQITAKAVSGMMQAFADLNQAAENALVNIFPEGSIEREFAEIDRRFRESLRSMVDTLQNKEIFSMKIPAETIFQRLLGAKSMDELKELLGVQLKVDTQEAKVALESIWKWLQNIFAEREKLRKIAMVSVPLEEERQVVDLYRQQYEALQNYYEIMFDRVNAEYNKIKALKESNYYEELGLRIQLEKLRAEPIQTEIIKERIRALEELIEHTKELHSEQEQLAELMIRGSWIQGMKYAFKETGAAMTEFERGIQVGRDAVQALSENLEQFFDINSDRFMDFGKLVENIMNDIYKALMRTLIIEPLVKGLSEMIGGLFTPAPAVGYNITGGAWSGGEYGLAYNPIKFPSFQTGTEYVPKTGLYMLHEGEKVLPAHQSSPSFSVFINVENKTGIPVSAKEADIKYDNQMKKYVKNIVLELSDTDPTFRRKVNVRRF